MPILHSYEHECLHLFTFSSPMTSYLQSAPYSQLYPPCPHSLVTSPRWPDISLFPILLAHTLVRRFAVASTPSLFLFFSCCLPQSASPFWLLVFAMLIFLSWLLEMVEQGYCVTYKILFVAYRNKLWHAFKNHTYLKQYRNAVFERLPSEWNCPT